MKARYANLTQFNRVVNTYKWLVDLFGDKEFTAGDFSKAKHNYRRYTYNSLAFLRDEGIIKAVRTEKVSKEIDLPSWGVEDFLIDKNGNSLMTARDWAKLPEIARTALLAMNGQDFRFERKDTKIVETEKYIYTVNPDGMLNWRKSYGRLLAMRADALAGEIANLTEKRDAFLACQF